MGFKMNYGKRLFTVSVESQNSTLWYFRGYKFTLLAASPDRLINNDSMVEIKCPTFMRRGI